jgi:cytochrome c oxidase assembly protein subunit 15
MNGRWIPDEVLLIDPWWQNFLHNMATVQLVHRTLAMTILALVAVTWWRARHDRRPAPRAATWATALLVAAGAQVAVGISTLLLQVPLPLAALHQAGAVIVFTCAVGLLHAVGGPRGLQA